MNIPNNNMKITVIVPVINMGNKISKCLESISNQTYLPYEIIIVDGHSTDDTVTNAQKFNTIILYEDYGTRAGANQVGINNANGDFIAFTDADCIPHPEWLEKLINEFDEGIVGVGGSVKNVGESLWLKSINLSLETFLGSANSVQGRRFKHKKFVANISGCNSIFRKKDLLNVGGFATNLRTAEDTELNSKLLKYGKILYVPEAVVVHDHGRGLKNFSKRMRQYGSGRANSLLFDLQVIPPILGMLVFVSAFFYFKVFIYFLLLYLLLVFIYTIKIFIKNPNPLYLLTIPFTFFIEHISYSVGFWAGILKITGGLVKL